MKALTIRQPWAHAILHLGKDVENRSWPTRYRGPLLIHAAASLAPRYRLYAAELGLDPSSLVLGSVVGMVELVDCVKGYHSKWADAGSWHWILANPRAFVRPWGQRGRLGLYELDLRKGEIR